ncbi:MAG TPA: SGNH/GDSL hydrolase family protein [Candidatus Dormibacteraeota bacterium]|jgi:lysophospholipase L1-like esterase|nr:SGNH/GDSL hydrolase family protein [Candidatus Dormibacteraeota bacterium]
MAATAGAAVLLLAACGASSPGSLHPGPAVGDAGRAEVYVALGASETVGTGLNDEALRLRDTWAQLFFNEALPRAATMYNLAVPGITTAAAQQSEVAPALTLHPTVATVFFTIDDLVAGVPATDYETNLEVIVHAVRQGGRAIVLVGNAPHIDQLPAYRACLSGSAFCPLAKGFSVPGPAAVNAMVDAYNAAVARVVAREGAVLVDVAAHAADIANDPANIAPDGLHPSPRGHAALAALFLGAYQAAVQRR